MLSVHTCPLATLGGKKTGGMNVYVRELARELARRGILVDIYTRDQGICEQHGIAYLGENCRVIHVPAGPVQPLSTIEHYDLLPQFSQAMLAHALGEGLIYDLVFSHYWLSGCVALELSQHWPSTPIAQMFHTLGLMKNRVARNERDREPPLRSEQEKRVMQQVDLIVAATPAEEAQIQWLYGADVSKAVIVPPGVDLERFSPIPLEEARQQIGVPAEDGMILFVGRIEPLKGVDTLLRAITILRAGCSEESPCLYLVIIGGDPDDPAHENAEMERLKQMRIELGIEDVVTFLGAKDQDSLQYYYSAAEVVVMPSHYESFGMVALEAMACGTPVIASEVGGLAFLVQDGETGYHVEDQNATELAGKLSLLLEDPDLRGRMSRQAVTYSQAFAWQKIADQLLAAFEPLVTNGSSARKDENNDQSTESGRTQVGRRGVARGRGPV